MIAESHDPFLKWVDETDMTERLRNSLRRYHQLFPGIELGDIKEMDFCGMDFVGKGQWKELCRLHKRSERTEQNIEFN